MDTRIFLTILKSPHLGGRFGYFLFFLLGEGEGRVRGAEGWGVGGVDFLLKIPKGGGVGSPGGGGAEGPGGCLRRIGDLGGGLNIFFGAETSTKLGSNVGYSGTIPLTFRETKSTVRVSLQECLFTGSSKVTSYGLWQKRVRFLEEGFDSTPEN